MLITNITFTQNSSHVQVNMHTHTIAKICEYLKAKRKSLSRCSFSHQKKKQTSKRNVRSEEQKQQQHQQKAVVMMAHIHTYVCMYIPFVCMKTERHTYTHRTRCKRHSIFEVILKTGDSWSVVWMDLKPGKAKNENNNKMNDYVNIGGGGSSSNGNKATNKHTFLNKYIRVSVRPSVCSMSLCWL